MNVSCCSGALWILKSVAILYEPEHEITVPVGLSCNEGSDKLVKMRMLVRVPPNDQGELRLILENEYGISSETHSIHATDTLNSNPCWHSSRRCCQGRGFESR